MSSNLETTPTMQERFAEVFAHLPEQDIEQFYAHYQLWVLRHRVPILEKQIEALQEHRAENQQLLQKLQPPSIALAVLARLQSNGVNDVTLLDLMLDRGEDWLDRMMQRLDYCEQVEDFIQGDYNQWCLNSLEGAYDWIDTLRGNQREETETGYVLNAEEVANSELTEELLLQKLSFDEDAPPATPPTQPAAVQAEPPAAEEIIIFEQPAADRLDEEITFLESQPVAEGNVESTMLALFLNQGEATETEADTPEKTPGQISPAPWYSVNLPEDELLELNQVDWIKMLQQDTVTRPEAGATAVAEHSAAEIIQSEAASHSSAEETLSNGEMTTPSAETEPESANVVAETALEEHEFLNAALDETQIPGASEQELDAADEPDTTRTTDSEVVLEQDQSETEATTIVEELEPTTLEITPEPGPGVSVSEDSSSENLEVAPVEQTPLPSEESHILSDAHESDETPEIVEAPAVTLTEEIMVIAEPDEQTTLEEAEPASPATLAENDETHLAEPEQSEVVVSVDESETLMVDAANSAESLEVVNDETRETGSDTDTTDETPLQQQTSDPLEAVGLYYYTPATEEQQPAWYDYLEGDPEMNRSLKQEWQITPEAQPDALMWENKTGSVADELTQPMLLREIKLASETQSATIEDQKTAQAEHMLPAEDQKTLSVVATESGSDTEEQTAQNASQEPPAPLLTADQQVFPPENARESIEQTLVVTQLIEELPAEEIQETVQTISEAGQTVFKEETIQIQENVSSERVEHIEEVRVVAVQPEQAQPALTPINTTQEPPKKPGFWRRLFRRK